jgi:hypothetical protein
MEPSGRSLGRDIRRPLFLPDDAILTAKAHRDGTAGRTHAPPLAPQGPAGPRPDETLTTMTDRNYKGLQGKRAPSYAKR